MLQYVDKKFLQVFKYPITYAYLCNTGIPIEKRGSHWSVMALISNRIFEGQHGRYHERTYIVHTSVTNLPVCTWLPST